MNIIKFTPTYLYIKQHTITGKMYFGKTIDDPEKYPGSGTHWKDHIKKHGKEHVETIWYCLFFDKETISEFALKCSTQWNIVESKEWLNKIPENGLDGGCPGVLKTGKAAKGVPKSDEHKLNMSIARTGVLKKGKPLGPTSEETKIKMSIASKGKPKSEEHKLNMSIAQKKRRDVKRLDNNVA